VESRGEPCAAGSRFAFGDSPPAEQGRAYFHKVGTFDCTASDPGFTDRRLPDWPSAALSGVSGDRCQVEDMGRWLRIAGSAQDLGCRCSPLAATPDGGAAPQ
jgi:hypothetical protein